LASRWVAAPWRKRHSRPAASEAGAGQADVAIQADVAMVRLMLGAGRWQLRSTGRASWPVVDWDAITITTVSARWPCTMAGATENTSQPVAE